MNSMKNISIQAHAGRDFYLLLGDFLEEYYAAPPEKKTQMLSEPPDNVSRREGLPFLAATAHKLCNDDGISPPAWVFDERCYLRDAPFFACRAKGNLRLLFMYKSPIEFKHRNLFVDENALVRV